jgi:serine/threonine-protein kinase HipA
VADELAVWLYGERVSLISEERGRLRLAYTEAALSRYTLGTPLLSVTLPVQPERHPQGVVRAFLDGLLPEGQSRLAVADDFNLRASDTFGLIRAIGRDCAGAVVIQPADDPAPPQASTLSAEPLSESDIERLVANLRTAPLGVDERVRVSLGGVQEKLLLTRMPDGSWGRPVDGTPSTHILKPELARFPASVENEAFCMRLARHLGLSVAHVETSGVNGRKLLVVERYDRTVHPNGDVERIHQEDLCQATATPPDKKYEENGGPSLRRIAQILEAVAQPSESVETLLRAMTLSVLIGNGDAHAKNLSLLHKPSGALDLAPLYDLMSTLHYRDDHLAMYIDTVQRTTRVTGDRLVNEATRWGIAKRRAVEIIGDLIQRAPAAVTAAQDETPHLPTEISTLIGAQLAQMQRGLD